MTDCRAGLYGSNSTAINTNTPGRNLALPLQVRPLT